MEFEILINGKTNEKAKKAIEKILQDNFDGSLDDFIKPQDSLSEDNLDKIRSHLQVINCLSHKIEKLSLHHYEYYKDEALIITYQTVIDDFTDMAKLSNKLVDEHKKLQQSLRTIRNSF